MATTKALEELGVPPEKVLISNKLAWKRVPLKHPGAEPTFEPGAWVNLKNDAVQDISYQGIKGRWQFKRNFSHRKSALILAPKLARDNTRNVKLGLKIDAQPPIPILQNFLYNGFPEKSLQQPQPALDPTEPRLLH